MVSIYKPNIWGQVWIDLPPKNCPTAIFEFGLSGDGVNKKSEFEDVSQG